MVQVAPAQQNLTDASPPSGDSLLSLENVWKIYDLGEIQVEALRGVSVEVVPGEFVAVMGASGSGKSTLLNLLGCLDRPTRGRYRLDGIDVSTFSASQRADIRNQKIGFIFQSFNLLPRTSIWENVEAPMLYAGVSRQERARRVEEALEVVGIPEKAQVMPNQLSGGQQQRVAVARALVNRPAILLADEPTGNLDSATSEEIMRFLVDLNQDKGITLIMVTHEASVAIHAKRTIQVRDGLIVSDRIH